MTVRTTNIALRDLQKYSTPWFVHREDDDIVLLKAGIPMIEVQNDDVALAVDAWMGSEVLADERTVLVAVATDPRDLLLDVGVEIADVVLTPVPRVTCATPALASALALVCERKGLNRLEPAAVVAPLGRGRRRQREGD